jgi:molybdate transport system regulatory protein
MPAQSNSKPVALRVSLRIDVGPGCSIGPGKIALLEAIRDSGSLSEGARSLGMSYRRAWLLLDDLNRSFEQRVAVTAAGGARGGGAQLTEHGHELVRDYRHVEQAALKAAGKHMGQARVQSAPPASRLRKPRKKSLR